MKRCFAFLVWLLLLTAPLAGSQFVFLHDNPKLNHEMRLVLEVASLRLQKLLDVKLPDTITVGVVTTQEQFDSLAGGRLPEWGAAAAIPQRNLMLLREPMMDRYPGTMANLLQHELAHIALHYRASGNRVPRFIDEGFASWFAGEWEFANVTAVAAAQITKSIFPLRDIDNVNSFHQAQANLAYSQSYLVVHFIYQRYGELGFIDLMEAFARGKELEEAFRQGLGISFTTFEADYRKYLSDNYTLWSILADSMGFWIFLAIVVILAFLLLRKKRRDAFQRWREEEKFESADFDWSGSDDEPWKTGDDDNARR